VKAKAVRAMVDKYWGEWKRGSYKPEIPVEPPQNGPRTAHVDWPSPTLPIVVVAYKAPAYNDATKETAALDALASLAFSSTSDLYQKLVVQEQKADAVNANAPGNMDAGLFEITARVKKVEDLDYVRERILETVKAFQEKPVDTARLDTVRKRLRYQVALSMDNSDTIAQILSYYVALKRTPETMNALYDRYAMLTPEDVRQVAAKYLVEKGRTIVTLTGPGGVK
jgi:zinc protease